MTQDTEPLSGIVEADETYIGGKREGKRGRGAEGKTPVFGVVQRDGGVKTKIVENVKAETLLPLIDEMVAPGSLIATDESGSYNKVDSLFYTHGTVRHAAARGLSCGTDWNNGTHAKLCGYRQKLLEALAKLKETEG